MNLIVCCSVAGLGAGPAEDSGLAAIARLRPKLLILEHVARLAANRMVDGTDAEAAVEEACNC